MLRRDLYVCSVWKRLRFCFDSFIFAFHWSALVLVGTSAQPLCLISLSAAHIHALANQCCMQVSAVHHGIQCSSAAAACVCHCGRQHSISNLPIPASPGTMCAPVSWHAVYHPAALVLLFYMQCMMGLQTLMCLPYMQC